MGVLDNVSNSLLTYANLTFANQFPFKLSSTLSGLSNLTLTRSLLPLQVSGWYYRAGHSLAENSQVGFNSRGKDRRLRSEKLKKKKAGHSAGG